MSLRTLTAALTPQQRLVKTNVCAVAKEALGRPLKRVVDDVLTRSYVLLVSGSAKLAKFFAFFVANTGSLTLVSRNGSVKRRSASAPG